jgi:hypothetical protein
VGLTDAEHKRLKKEAALCGMTMSDFIVVRTLGLRCDQRL